MGPAREDSASRSSARDLAGNAIDFGMKVLKLSFHDTMLEITRR